MSGLVFVGKGVPSFGFWCPFWILGKGGYGFPGRGCVLGWWVRRGNGGELGEQAENSFKEDQGILSKQRSGFSDCLSCGWKRGFYKLIAVRQRTISQDREE